MLAQGQTGPATQYRDEEEGGAEPLAGQAELSSSHANERTFIKLLDKELHKITEFYVDKGAFSSAQYCSGPALTRVLATERELLGDLVLLKEDLERLREEEDADLSLADSVSSSRPRRPSGSFGNAVRNKPSNIGATSGGSDSEGDEEDEDDADTRKKGAFAKILNDPREYAEASRAGRKSARRASVGGKGKTAAKPGRRARALSSASETGDLLGLHEADGEEDEDEEEEGDDEEESRTRRPAGAQQPARAGFAPPARRPTMSKQRGLSRLSNSLLTTEEEGLMSGATGGAVWEGLSDWAIDTRIMYKRRLAGLFTVRLSLFAPRARVADSPLTCLVLPAQTLSELKQYVDLNYTGLSKVLKK